METVSDFMVLAVKAKKRITKESIEFEMPVLRDEGLDTKTMQKVVKNWATSQGYTDVEWLVREETEQDRL